MKTLVTFILIVVATSAWAQLYNVNTGQDAAALPRTIKVNGNSILDPSFSEAATVGWRYKLPVSNAPQGCLTVGYTWLDIDGTSVVAILTTRTTNEQAQIDASNAVAHAEWMASLPPPEFPKGIALPDTLLTNPVYGVVCEGGDLLTYVAHASPYDPVVAASNRTAAIAARKQIKTDLRAIKGSINTNRASVQAEPSLTNGFTAAECRALVNTLRRELIDAMADMQALRRAQADALKEANP